MLGDRTPCHDPSLLRAKSVIFARRSPQPRRAHPCAWVASAKAAVHLRLPLPLANERGDARPSDSLSEASLLRAKSAIRYQSLRRQESYAIIQQHLLTGIWLPLRCRNLANHLLSANTFAIVRGCPTSMGFRVLVTPVGSARERLPMPKLLFAILAVLLVAVPVDAATMYISDQFTVPLRRGPSSTHRILHAGLPSGMALETISEDKAAGYTEVRTPTGTEGWIETQYLTAEPVAKDRLTAANRRVQALETELKSVRENYQQARGTGASAESRSNELSKDLAKAQNELAEIKRVSATSIAQYEENKKLKSTNQELQAQVSQLSERVNQLERNAALRWFLAGGVLVVAGLVLGVMIKARPKRSSWA